MVYLRSRINTPILDAELSLRQPGLRILPLRRRRPGRRPAACENGCPSVPEGPGIDVQLDRDRVAQYAELYEREAENFSFHESGKMARTPLMPKR